MVGFRPFLVVFVSVKVSSLRWCTLNRCCLRSQSVVMVLMAFVILSPLLLVLFLSSVVFQPFFVDTPQNHYRYQVPPPPPVRATPQWCAWKLAPILGSALCFGCSYGWSLSGTFCVCCWGSEPSFALSCVAPSRYMPTIQLFSVSLHTGTFILGMVSTLLDLSIVFMIVHTNKYIVISFNLISLVCVSKH